LSLVLINLRPLNDTGTLTNFTKWLETIQAINRCTIRHRGQAIFSMRGDDAAALAVMRHNYRPWLANGDDVNDERVCVTLPIFMGRRAFDVKSCFPASRRGELSIELDLDIADTGYNALNYNIETVELLGATPVEYERKVELAQTFAATGVNDVDLPLGNLVRGFLLFGTTGFAGATPAPSWGRVSLIADGVGVGVSSADFETLHNITGLRASPPVEAHEHQFEPVSGVQTLGVVDQGQVDWALRAYMDLDPLLDDAFSIDSSRVSRLQIRAEAETADAVRVIPVERIRV
jgi:hypothetical protein